MLVTIVAALACAASPQIADPDPVYNFDPVTILDPFELRQLEINLFDVAPTGDGGAFVAGSIAEPGVDGLEPLVMRVDASGEPLWIRTEPITETATGLLAVHVVPDGDGGVYLVWTNGVPPSTSDVVISQYSGSGVPIFRRSAISSPFPAIPLSLSLHFQARSVISDGSGGLFIGLFGEPMPGSTAQAGTRLVHLPSIGAQETISMPFGPDVTGIPMLERMPDGGFAAILNREPLQMSLARLDANLQQIWEVPLPTGQIFSRPTALAASPDGSFYVGLDNFGAPNLSSSQVDDLLKFSGTDGSILWSQNIVQPAPARTILDLVALPDGGVLTAGTRGFFNARQPYLERYAADGSLLADQTVETPGDRGSMTRLVPDGDDWLALRLINRTTPSGLKVSAAVLRLADLTEVGSPYCGPAALNSTGAAGETRAFGSALAADNGLVLRSSGLPTGVFGLYVLGSEQGLTPIVGSSAGRLCIAGTLGRVMNSIGETGLDGTATYLLDLSALPTSAGPVSAMAGDQWNFQYWHRDDPAVSSSNATDAVSVTLN